MIFKDIFQSLGMYFLRVESFSNFSLGITAYSGNTDLKVFTHSSVLKTLGELLLHFMDELIPTFPQIIYCISLCGFYTSIIA